MVTILSDQSAGGIVFTWHFSFAQNLVSETFTQWKTSVGCN